MKISDDIAVPPVVHDKCDLSLLDVSVSCKMKDNVLECASSDCGGENFECDCNIYEFVYFFVLFDSLSMIEISY